MWVCLYKKFSDEKRSVRFLSLSPKSTAKTKKGNVNKRVVFPFAVVVLMCHFFSFCQANEKSKYLNIILYEKRAECNQVLTEAACNAEVWELRNSAIQMNPSLLEVVNISSHFLILINARWNVDALSCLNISESFLSVVFSRKVLNKMESHDFQSNAEQNKIEHCWNIISSNCQYYLLIRLKPLLFRGWRDYPRAGVFGRILGLSMVANTICIKIDLCKQASKQTISNDMTKADSRHMCFILSQHFTFQCAQIINRFVNQPQK